MAEDDIRAIEQSTREQGNSSQWFQSRRFRLTSSLFGVVLQRRDTTPLNFAVTSSHVISVQLL